MMSCAPSCLKAGLMLLWTLAAAFRNCARRSLFTLLEIGVITILPSSRLIDTSLPGSTPAATRMCLGMPP